MLNLDRKVVDFADFNIEGVRNRNTAQILSVILMAYINMDDIVVPDLDQERKYPSTIGTGGNGGVWHVQNQTQQRTLLASYFAAFGSGHYNHCYLALPEYYCLKDLLTYLEDDYCLINEIIVDQKECLKTVLKEFEREYVRRDPTFLFKMLQT